ncbi:MAG: MmcQ/YjbR family DNA-binding protein [Acidimicrobiia bacterium]|nr:MmcQ/YjbR family DNA-binding protein [Acidimicrobiia bacterium]
MIDAEALTQRLREICLALPDATEQETWGHPTFRVRKKIFVGCGVDDDGRFTTSMKAAPGEQEVLLAEGHPFFFPKYVGSKGWIGVELGDDTDWDEIAELVEDSYRAIAPKTLTKKLDA